MTNGQNVPPVGTLARLRLYACPVAIALGTLLIDLIARWMSGFDIEFIHVFEGSLFPIAALMLLLAARHDSRFSFDVFRLDLWLALALGLAGLRSALWAAGLEPLQSNGIVFVLGVPLASFVFIFLRRKTAAKPPGRI